MKVTPLALSGLLLLEPRLHEDERGFFVERFRESLFQQHGLPTRFIQDNHSRSAPGVLRGLHYQLDPAQGKLVMVMRGRILDVVVDIRADSPTIGQHVAIELSDEHIAMLWVPAGFAHGFCVNGDTPADVLYKTDAPYNPAGEGGLLWNDPDLQIEWPIQQPLISSRDQQLPRFAEFLRQRKGS